MPTITGATLSFPITLILQTSSSSRLQTANSSLTTVVLSSTSSSSQIATTSIIRSHAGANGVPDNHADFLGRLTARQAQNQAARPQAPLSVKSMPLTDSSSGASALSSQGTLTEPESMCRLTGQKKAVRLTARDAQLKDTSHIRLAFSKTVIRYGLDSLLRPAGSESARKCMFWCLV